MVNRRMRAERRREQLETPQYGWLWKPLVALVALALVVAIVLGVWWSLAPKRFDVETATAEQRAVATPASRGAVTVATLATLVDTLLDKPGGYLRNDILPPGVVMDNMPAWELGVLKQVRLLTQSLPTMEGSSGESVARINEALGADPDDWFKTSTEDRLEAVRVELDAYLETFGESGSAAFGARGRGVGPWLDDVGGSLDALIEQLSASVGDDDMLADVGLAAADGVNVPWYRVDNVFHQARGQTWALRQLLEAVERDQSDAIASAGLDEDWQRLLVEIERSQRQLWSPVVLNGSGFGVFANYPLMMAHDLTRARTIIDRLVEGLGGVASEPEAIEPPVTEVDQVPEAVGDDPSAQQIPEGQEVVVDTPTSDLATEGDMTESDTTESRMATDGADSDALAPSQGEAAGEETPKE